MEMKLEEMKFKFMDLRNYYIKCIAKYGQHNALKYFKQRMQFFSEDSYKDLSFCEKALPQTGWLSD